MRFTLLLVLLGLLYKFRLVVIRHLFKVFFLGGIANIIEMQKSVLLDDFRHNHIVFVIFKSTCTDFKLLDIAEVGIFGTQSDCKDAIKKVKQPLVSLKKC